MPITSDNNFTINAVQYWMLTEGRSCRTVPRMIREFAAEMRKYDVQVDRIFFATTLLHPQAAAWGWKWEYPDVENEIVRCKAFYDNRHQIVGHDAPLIQLETKDTVRIQKADDHIPPDCRVMFEEDGYMDLYGLRYVVHGETGGGITWSTKRSTGFSEDNIEFFSAIMPALSTVMQLLLNDLCMHSLLRTYLGNDPGTRVYSGSITRGDVLTIRSVVWFSDIRGFTELSGLLDRNIVTDLVNDVCEITHDLFQQKRGEILKFMGDGIMGVFTAVEGDDEDKACLCGRAREAAEELQLRLRELRTQREEKGLPGASVGVGLHYGNVSYGNIGAPSRLDFTVLGPSVNLSSRIEGLCSKLKVSVLASEEFVSRDSKRNAWISCGEHELKGVADPVKVFELASSKEQS